MSRDLIQTTAGIIQSYVSNNPIEAEQLTGLIGEVFNSLEELSQKGSLGDIDAATAEDLDRWVDGLNKKERTGLTKLQPAVAVDQAVQEDSVTCLICGKTCKALKGHLTRTHKLDVADYRAMFNLPKDFPMTAPNYSARRRVLAEEVGLSEKLQASRERKKKQSS
ncbi:transcriptional regulator, MucR family [Magnetococcus marinus MC-1]|uniref:Transcriptional regulator, MucR family n=1 Tax=Magnetococcus marinus (strain ATCC BAA-1437 / JCM 17883 / MC-1) TaxID=156889 RepID=A0L9Z7_MAGMM|nr:MucR family transcriptional regulator [Magnetococcus marinus]ABK44790.1 transcriptional regulator, MucR family [Magnetococcus marinus MC-1]